jgi:hypothetical protein
MNYKARIKLNLMKGRTFMSKGQGIAGTGNVPRMRITGKFRQGGTISNRVAVGSLEPLMQQLSLTTPTIKRKKASKKSSKKGKGASKKTNYKSLKFNF